ncbi:hypothetical protein SCH4B_0093 [Ruegeria sp. TrichCH4B]|nr:hypothetical protein SCH4B_0093 [Ruegeria sp. TrichCH4B]
MVAYPLEHFRPRKGLTVSVAGKLSSVHSHLAAKARYRRLLGQQFQVRGKNISDT